MLPAQIVLIGIGVIPNTQLAEQLGLAVDNGVVVDRFALASDGTTVAVGDCANMPNPVPGSEPGERIRLESVNNAIEHAKVAAYSLTGRREEYAGIPWFWSNQADLKLQIAGLCNGYDQTVLRRDEERGKFSVLYYRQGQDHRRGLRQRPAGLHGREERAGEGPEHPGRRRGGPRHSTQDHHHGQLTALRQYAGPPEGAL